MTCDDACVELTHIRLLIDDFSGCFRFYRDVLGLPTSFSDDGGPYAEFKLGGDKFLGLFSRLAMTDVLGTGALPADVEIQDRVALVLHVDDVDAEAERLEEGGIPLVAEPSDRPDWGLRTLHVRDPDGNLIELWSPIGGKSDDA